jgi:hypothetical protein
LRTVRCLSIFNFGRYATAIKDMPMRIARSCLSATVAGCLSAMLLAGAWLPRPASAMAASELTSHRAIYELTLKQSRGKTAPAAARGRILYDFSGSTCEGYVLTFRQVSELDNGEGKITLSDLRSTTWEDGAANTFRFKSQSYLNQQLVESVDGQAKRKQDAIAITLTKPNERTIDIGNSIVFPTEHMRRILIAAREGKTILDIAVYDGADTGMKVYNTLTVIGAVIPPDADAPTDAAAGQSALAGLKRWPVTISYFDRAADPGDQTPLYAISFEVYENGVSRALLLDYNTFSISGEMTSLEIRSTKPCG